MENYPKTPLSSLSITPKCKSVILRQWWLLNQSRLSVGGFLNKQTGISSSSASAKSGAFDNQTQEFHSAPILKKLNNNTLEAEDGTVILILGCINTSRTLSSGFSHEVCDRFRTGFPCAWEDCAAKETEKSFPVTFDDHPVTQVRDLIMTTTGESESRAITNIIFRDILKHCSDVSRNQNADSVDSDGVYVLNPTPKIIDKHKSNSVPVNLHEKDLETSKKVEVEGGGFMSNLTHKISKKNGMQRTGSQTRYPLRSMKRRKTLEVSDLVD